MKRKRGHKKGHKPKTPTVVVPPTEAVGNANSQDNSRNDESGMEVDTPSSTGTDQPLNLANINPDGSIDKKAAGKPVGRVKVKLKPSKVLDSDVPSQSDTDKGSPQVGFERQGLVNEKMEDSATSADTKIVSKKAGGIKIKSSRMLGGSSNDNSGTAAPTKGGTSFKKGLKTQSQGSRYNKQELDSALTVIKKVMKMEAAAPFNEPVNPEALGIPDYFDIIRTPMDFGTICNNLEKSDKYMDSKDVYKDVQYIWDNCCKYNNKGDAILDLMRRVKKNFMKYWMAAGLYSEQSRGMNGVESTELEDAAPSGKGKSQMKAGQSKVKNRKHGRRHKSDCLCAICVLKRRKREREASARVAKGQIGVQDLKHEESSPVESPCGEDSSHMGESLDADADAEVEDEKDQSKPEVREQQYRPMEERPEEEEEEEEEEDEEENEIKILNQSEGETKEQSQSGDKLAEEPSKQSPPDSTDKLGAAAENLKESTPTRNKEDSIALQQQRHKETKERQQKAKVLEKFQVENPLLTTLCGTLFPDNQQSVWSGPHSLLHHQSSRTSSIHAAIEMFMK